MGYKNFKLAVYCRVGDLNRFPDMKSFEIGFGLLEKHLKIDKVYLEAYRSDEWISPAKLLEFKKLFEGKGIKASGGITTTVEKTSVGFNTLCYTNPEHRVRLRSAAELAAGIFDEIILDDFFFTNCKCESCIKARGNTSWSSFRTRLMREVAEELVIAPAKRVNPHVNVILKYPNWYEHYQETGYDLLEEPGIFDMIYTGTETRDPLYTNQHLPKYLSYFIMRYLENIKPGKNAGGWFDPFECKYNLCSYIDQANVTLFGKAREVTLFCLSSLTDDIYSLFAPAAGRAFEGLDKVLGELGKPLGVPCYKPFHSEGEDYLHNYIGMLGIPLEPVPFYPYGSKYIFLTEGASKDGDILDSIEKSLMGGSDVIVTSGLLKVLESRGFDRIANIRHTGRKASIKDFAISKNGVTMFHVTSSAKPVQFPQLSFATNDAWQLVSGLGEDNNFPLLLSVNYGKGRLYILTIPEDFGDLYSYPQDMLNILRGLLKTDCSVEIDAPSRVVSFVYDNGTFVLESFLQRQEDVKITVDRPGARLLNLATGMEKEGTVFPGKTVFTKSLLPESYVAYKIV